MKTIFYVRSLLITVALSFMLISCSEYNMLQEDTQVLTDVATKTSKITSKGISPLTESEKIVVDLPVTKEMEAAVIDVVKPVKEIVEKLLNEDKTGIYEAYKKDVDKFISLKEDKEKEIFITAMYEMYLPFFQQVWKKADIDEEAYQLKIKNIFPEDIQETIRFTEFLNFSMHVKKHTRDNNPPPAPPIPENICVSPQAWWFGITHINKSVFSISNAMVSDANVSTSTLADVAGFANATAGVASDITIPSTFPDDDKFLRVKKTFMWHGMATAISLLGCSFASTQYSTVANEEFIRLWAPVTWLSTTSFDVPKTEEYIILKKYLYNIRYGVSTYSDSFAELFASSTSSSHCYQIRWSVCEE